MLDTLSQVLHIAAKLKGRIEAQQLAKAKAMVAAEVIGGWVGSVLGKYYRERPLCTSTGMFLSEQMTLPVFLSDKTGVVTKTTKPIDELERDVIASVTHILAVDGLQVARRMRIYLTGLDFIVAANDAVPIYQSHESEADFVSRGKTGIEHLLVKTLS